MAVGYVLINVKPGLELQAYEIIKAMEGIADVDLLFGDYDIIVKIVADNMGSIAKIVVENIRQVEGVDNTKTLAGAEVWGRPSKIKQYVCRPRQWCREGKVKRIDLMSVFTRALKWLETWIRVQGCCHQAVRSRWET